MDKEVVLYMYNELFIIRSNEIFEIAISYIQVFDIWFYFPTTTIYDKAQKTFK